MKKMMFNDRYGLTNAVIEKRKTVTRRLPSIPKSSYGGMEILDDILTTWDCNGNEIPIKPPYVIGEIVAVAQSYQNAGYAEDKIFYRYIKEHDGYLQGLAIKDKGWSNKMFVCADLMPHQIRILDVRAERLQDITNEDCLREGIKDYTYFNFPNTNQPYDLYTYDNDTTFNTPKQAFIVLIDKISGKGTWNSNPFVWRIEIELVTEK